MNGFVNRYKNLGLSVDRSLRNYSTRKSEQKAFEAMQQSVILLGEQLLGQPDGACADINGEMHWLSIIGDKLLVLASFDVQNRGVFVEIPENADGVSVWDFRSMKAKDSLGYKKEIDEWLENPTFCFADQDYLNKAALAKRDYTVINETNAFIKAITEAKELDANIQSSATDKQEFSF